ncbi:MAG: molybdopterin-synthase adenylyltransferase MoeB [Anaerolineae bacterium]|nr:MAG: molybdopterin-synthase adenylyltransferase MoeB [Anaerolineae bacterium]
MNGSSFTPEELRRYSRHLLIPEVGMAGQRRLKDSAVLVVGVGGLGSPAAQYLAAAGVGRLGLVDFDVVSESNLQRQVLYGNASLGQRKVEAARARLNDLNPEVEVTMYDRVFDRSSAMEIANGYSLILDGTDNFPTRYLTNDLCVKLGIPNVYGSIYRFEGQVSLFDGRSGPCYRCLFPEPPPPGSVPSCAEGGVLGVLPGVIGSLQAAEALKWLLGIGEMLQGWLLLYNALDASVDRIRLRKNPECRVCGRPPEEIELIDYEQFCGVPIAEAPHGRPMTAKVAPRELVDELKGGKDIKLIDVREPHELEISALEGTINIPIGSLPERLKDLDTQQAYVVMCRSGSRSARGVDLMHAAGFGDVRNLEGGINEWARVVDPHLSVY